MPQLRLTGLPAAAEMQPLCRRYPAEGGVWQGREGSSAELVGLHLEMHVYKQLQLPLGHQYARFRLPPAPAAGLG